MAVEFTKDEIIDRIINAVPIINPNIKKYRLFEYNNFYLIASEGFEPIMFEKEHGFPSLKNYSSIPASECKNPQLIEEIGYD